MRLFLLSLSLLLTALCSGAQTADRHIFRIDIAGGSLSGIMLTRADSITVTGSLINEFGISAVDFIYHSHSRKMKLVSITDFLDRWYIRRTLRADLALCTRLLYDLPGPATGRAYAITTGGDTTTVVNTRRHITYTFAPLKTNDAIE